MGLEVLLHLGLAVTQRLDGLGHEQTFEAMVGGGDGLEHERLTGLTQSFAVGALTLGHQGHLLADIVEGAGDAFQLLLYRSHLSRDGHLRGIYALDGLLLDGELLAVLAVHAKLRVGSSLLIAVELEIAVLERAAHLLGHVHYVAHVVTAIGQKHGLDDVDHTGQDPVGLGAGLVEQAPKIERTTLGGVEAVGTVALNLSHGSPLTPVFIILAER